MRYPLRTKIILFTVVPILLIYAALFGFGLAELHQQANHDAQRWLQEHARFQATRLARELDSLERLAGNIRDQVILQPQQPRHLLIAHLMDGLRRTPLANAAAVQFDQGRDNIYLRRGMLQPTGLPEPKQQQGPGPEGWQTGARSQSAPLSYRLPVRATDDFFGWVIVELALSDLYQLLERDRPKHIQLHLIDPEGAFILPPDNQPMASDNFYQLTDLPVDSAARASRLQHWQKDPQAHFLALIPLPGFPWQLAVIIAEEVALAPVQQQSNWASVLLALALGLIVLVVGFVTNHITRPLQELDASVNKIAQGNFAVSPRVRSNDELGRLARAIRTMAQRIRLRDEELTQSREELEQRVTTRTRELAAQIRETRQTEEALRLASEHAQEASKAKSEFLSNMSHELRTPLNGVLGYAQILRRDQMLKPAQRESLKAIESCGQHLLTLINDVLDLSKIEAGRMNLDIAPTHLQHLFKEVYDIVIQRAQMQGLALHMLIDPRLPVGIMTDATKLRQILLNLLGNAVKFTEHGSITLHAEIADDDNLRLIIEDTGTGIPADKINVIFDAFKQAEAGMVIGGTGLGLAINQHLIELLDGTPLQVESKLHKGSRFTFTLPLLPVNEELLPAIDTPVLEEDALLTLAAGQSAHILAVDDRPENRDIVQRLLNDAGFDMETVDNAPDGLALLREKHFDLVLMDIRMPGMDGLQAIRLIREDADLQDTRVIAMTASVFPEFRAQLKDAGFDDFIGKPFRSGELFRLIQQHTGVNYTNLHDDNEATPEGSNDWTPDLARTTAVQLEQAIQMGDISSLAQLADKLAQNPQAAGQDALTIMQHARDFDFDGLQALADRLKQF